MPVKRFSVLLTLTAAVLLSCSSDEKGQQKGNVANTAKVFYTLTESELRSTRTVQEPMFTTAHLAETNSIELSNGTVIKIRNNYDFVPLWYENGALYQAVLDGKHVLRAGKTNVVFLDLFEVLNNYRHISISYPVSFYPDGSLKSAYPAYDVRLKVGRKDLTFIRGDYESRLSRQGYPLTFHPNGSLASGQLLYDSDMNVGSSNIRIKHAGLNNNAVYFYPNGALKSAVAAETASLKVNERVLSFSAGSRIDFYIDGTPMFGKLSKDIKKKLFGNINPGDFIYVRKYSDDYNEIFSVQAIDENKGKLRENIPLIIAGKVISIPKGSMVFSTAEHGGSPFPGIFEIISPSETIEIAGRSIESGTEISFSEIKELLDTL